MSEKMKTETELRTNSNAYNRRTKEGHLIHEIHNSSYNHRYIIDAIKEGRARDLGDEPKMNKEQCIIIGSGPSLDDTMPYLKDWKGGVICTTSQARTLYFHGVEPTHIVGLDPFTMWEEISGVDWEKTKTKLVMHPGCFPEMAENWKGEILLFRQDASNRESFFSKELNMMYTERVHVGPGPRDFNFVPIIKTQITIFACSPPVQLFVAEMLNYGRAFLVGCDFAFSPEKSRFTEMVPKGERIVELLENEGDAIIKPDDKIEWIKVEHPYIKPELKKPRFGIDEKTGLKTAKLSDIKPQEKNDVSNTPLMNSEVITKNGLITIVSHLYYKKNMFSAIRLSMQDVMVCGKGSITELPMITPKEMLRKQFYKTTPNLKPKKLKFITEKYLASIGAYVIVSKMNGKEAFTFIESEKLEEEVYAYMKNMQLSYNCPHCGAIVQANDDKSHDGDKCPDCQKDGLKPRFDVDIEGNMKRCVNLRALKK